MAKEKTSTDIHFTIQSYAENTTIHGIKYLGDVQRPTCEKIFWVVIFAVSFIFLGFFVKDIFNKFNHKSAIQVEDDSPTPIYSIPFPAVTICPDVKIKAKFFPAEEARKWMEGRANNSMVLDLAYLICNQQLVTISLLQNPRNLTKYLNKSHIELLHNISPDVNDLILNITFASKDLSGIKLMPLSYILTNEGICFTFNIPSEIINDDPSLQTEYKYHNIQNKTVSWYNDYGYLGYPRFPRAVWGSGPGSGLHLILRAEQEDLNTFCQPTQIGYKILLHSPNEYPTTLEEFIAIPHSTLTRIKVTPKITKSAYDIWDLNPQDRNCFFDQEHKMKYFSNYRRINCKLECLANYTMQQYGCVHFSLPRNNSQPICGSDIKISQMYDSEEIMNSYFQYKAHILDKYEAELKDDEPLDFQKFYNFSCNCLPACNSVEYEYSIKMENFEMEKLWEKMYPNYTIEGKETAIDIFFGVTKVTGTTRKQFYTLTDLISNIGGLVGLFMGASIISIVEIIYFIIVRQT